MNTFYLSMKLGMIIFALAAVFRAWASWRAAQYQRRILEALEGLQVVHVEARPPARPKRVAAAGR